jgi:hypothetical protein
MHGSHLFEYAVIRVVPHVEREEFINVGVILICPEKKFLKTRFAVNETRLNALCEAVDLNELNRHVESFDRICKGEPDSGPIGRLPQKERFRWLTASRSTILQTSPVHPGLCQDPQDMIDKLFAKLVG